MIIYGYRRRNKVMGQVPYVCPQCQRNGYHSVVRTSRFFTLFWIPIIPLGSSTTARCNLCGFQEKVDNKRADAILTQAQAGGQPQVPAPAQQYPQTPQPGAVYPPAQQAPAQYQQYQQYQQYPQQQDPSQGQQGWR
ncbi:MAG TPA: hypothetical protein VKQ30_23540 [Ktedonobacterales bacterium]|nr:hypothetical protein [Ktedonobacterales bacterium]